MDNDLDWVKVYDNNGINFCVHSIKTFDIEDRDGNIHKGKYRKANFLLMANIVSIVEYNLEKDKLSNTKFGDSLVWFKVERVNGYITKVGYKLLENNPDIKTNDILERWDMLNIKKSLELPEWALNSRNEKIILPMDYFNATTDDCLQAEPKETLTENSLLIMINNVKDCEVKNLFLMLTEQDVNIGLNDGEDLATANFDALECINKSIENLKNKDE